MNHDHTHHHHWHSNTEDSQKGIRIAFWLNFSFTIIEIAGGIYTNSIAVLSDAVHDLGDSIALLFAMLMEKLSRKKSDQMLTFGYKRFSILGAFVNSVILISGSIFVLYTAFNRLFAIESVNAPGMIVMAAAGIFFNSLAVFRLRKSGGINVRVVFMHLLEDVLGWVSILIVSIVMFFFELPVLDPILSIVIAIFILSRIIPNLLRIGRIFLQYKPDDHEIHLLKTEIEKLDGVINIHDIHLWTLDGTTHIFSCHLAVSPELKFDETSEIIARMKAYLSEHGISHATIEAESADTKCDHCDLGEPKD